MLNYLKEFDLSDEVIESILKSNDLNIIKNLELMKKNVKEVINYLYELGVNNIENILLNRIDLFCLPLKLIKQNFTKLNEEMLVDILNNSVDDLINYNI